MVHPSTANYPAILADYGRDFHQLGHQNQAISTSDQLYFLSLVVSQSKKHQLALTNYLSNTLLANRQYQAAVDFVLINYTNFEITEVPTIETTGYNHQIVLLLASLRYKKLIR